MLVARAGIIDLEGFHLKQLTPNCPCDICGAFAAWGQRFHCPNAANQNFLSRKGTWLLDRDWQQLRATLHQPTWPSGQ